VSEDYFVPVCKQLTTNNTPPPTMSEYYFDTMSDLSGGARSDDEQLYIRKQRAFSVPTGSPLIRQRYEAAAVSRAAKREAAAVSRAAKREAAAKRKSSKKKAARKKLSALQKADNYFGKHEDEFKRLKERGASQSAGGCQKKTPAGHWAVAAKQNKLMNARGFEKCRRSRRRSGSRSAQLRQEVGAGIRDSYTGYKVQLGADGKPNGRTEVERFKKDLVKNKAGKWVLSSVQKGGNSAALGAWRVALNNARRDLGMGTFASVMPAKSIDNRNGANGVRLYNLARDYYDNR
jgi:hypothetical protein